MCCQALQEQVISGQHIHKKNGFEGKRKSWFGLICDVYVAFNCRKSSGYCDHLRRNLLKHNIVSRVPFKVSFKINILLASIL